MRTSLAVLALLLLAGCPAPADDADGDGFDAEEDCDDADPDVFPGADERCNGVDDDCDGEVDEDDAVDATTWYADTDHDGHGSPDDLVQACEQPEGYVDDASDCDDDDPDIPGQEVCDLWRTDEDCDGLADDDDPDASGQSARQYPDADGDRYGDSADPGTLWCHWMGSGWSLNDEDCDDTDPAVHPDQEDGCNDVDDDCDGVLKMMSPCEPVSSIRPN